MTTNRKFEALTNKVAAIVAAGPRKGLWLDEVRSSANLSVQAAEAVIQTLVTDGRATLDVEGRVKAA